jgi:hypothetical protein
LKFFVIRRVGFGNAFPGSRGGSDRCLICLGQISLRSLSVTTEGGASHKFYGELLGLPESAEKRPNAVAFATKPCGFAIRDHGAVDARLAEARERALQRGLAHVTDRDAGAGRLERARDPEADAGAGDEHHLVLEVEHGFILPRAMIR